MLNKASIDEISPEKEKRDLSQVVDEVTSRKISLKDRVVQGLRIVLFCALLLISAAPSCFIVLDRWLGKPINIRVVNKIWWETAILKPLPYPPYFLFIFPATLLGALFVFFWRTRSTLVFSKLDLGSIESLKEQVNRKRTCMGIFLLLYAFVMIGISVEWMLLTGRMPGWELLVALALFIAGQILLDFSADSFRSYFRAQKWFLFDAALFVLALCGALYALFGETKPNFILYLLFVLAAINFLRHRKVTPLLFWVSIASLVALTWRINDWHYVVIGDEYSFFTEVLNILDNRTVSELISTTFNGNFVYGTHPYFSSYIHDFFMKMFDNHNFGWRFSNPVLVACSLPFFYYFFKAFVPRKTAMIAVIFLGFAHYLLSFSKIGYNNLQAFFAMGLVLAAFTWALKSMKPIAFSATGLAMGFCFYIYPAALYVVPLPILGFLIFIPPINKAALKRWAWMILSTALLTYPLIAQPRYWQAKIPGTFLYTNAGDSLGMFVQNVLHNTLYSALSYLYSISQSHYVSGGYLDPLSSIFVVMGLVLLVKAVFPLNKPALFLVLSFLSMFVW